MSKIISKIVLGASLCALTAGAEIASMKVNSGSITIPSEWKGKSVRLEQQIAFCELDVHVNGEKVATAYAPDASAEISSALKYGAANNLKVEERVVANYYGRGDGPFGNKDDARRRRFGSMQLVARSASYIDDFFVRPSWREKKLYLDIEIESIEKANAQVSVIISDAPGSATIVKGEQKAKLENGSNVVKVEIPWENPIPWEPVANAKVYNCRVEMTVNGAKCDTNRRDALFGFREIWREGKNIFLNGHLQRFRMFWHQGLPKNPNDVHKYGFNLSNEAHKHWAYWFEKPEEMEQRSRAGIAVFTGMPSIYFVHDKIRTDPKVTAEFKRSLKAWMRTWRNYPCIVAASCGVNQICPERNMRPEILGQDLEKGGVVDNIEFASAIAREMNPNCLYYSHADGTEADISSSNLYFNFTPLQEREEWLSQWATNGILPWCAVEFGSPYYACWFHSRVPEMTEWLAAYYGTKAYECEDERMLRYSKSFAESCLRYTHGGWVNDKGGAGNPGPNSLYKFNSLAEEYSKKLVYRTNRAWRYYGQNCGMMYLISWDWDKPDNTDDGIIRTRQMQANGDLVTWLGGDPDPTDRTHAYRAGEEIKKSVVVCWDGLGENEVGFKVTIDNWPTENISGGTTIATYVYEMSSIKLTQGQICKIPFSVIAPEVQAKTSFRINVTFSAAKGFDNPANATCKRDSFDFEVYPQVMPKVRAKEKIALFDPDGKTAEFLKRFDIPFTKIDSLDSSSFTHLIVGARALSSAQGLEKQQEAVKKGLKILVLQQTAQVWEAMGFKVEDSMARQMFNVSLKGIDDHDLAYWRGSPVEPVAFGNVMKHSTRRGPRWTHHHAISGTPILIPQRAGFEPLVRGEFDLSYTALLKERFGMGAVYFCAFDFEGRNCPAADKVAAAILDTFLNANDVKPRKVYVSGGQAERLAKTLGVDYEKYTQGELDEAVLIVGRDSKLSGDEVKDALDDDATALIIANNAIAASICGTNGTMATFYRGKAGDHLRRFRDGVEYAPLKDGSSFKIVKDVIIDQLDPFQAGDRYRTGDGKAAHLERGGWGSVPKGKKDLFLRNASQSEDNFMRAYSLCLAGLGVSAGGRIFARSLYTKPSEQYEPITQYNVLGPWPSDRDDDHYMVDTIFPVDESKGGDSGKLAEEMAIKGDVQPNPRFHPLGLKYLPDTPADLQFLDWRPVVKSRADGYVDYATASPLIAAQSFCTCYCTGFFKRRTAGEITIRFGVDWRGKLWVNGQALEPVYGGHKDEGSKIYEHVKVHAGDNYISVKAGCGQSAKAFYLNISHEPQEGEIVRDRVSALDGIELYESANSQFDPYEYVYW